VNGIHDMGGMDGFGPIEVERDEPRFHHEWERRVFGMVLASAPRRTGTDAFRFAIERMEPEHYLRASYYERWMTAIATTFVEAGVLTREELARGAGGAFPLSRPAPELAVPALERPGAAPRFGAGSEVVVRNRHPHGHTRCPRYVRGKRGTVVRGDGSFALPDVAAHVRRPCQETSYGVRFAARELWGEDASASDAVHVDLWESYLELA
jgi:nitrile hydratase